MKFSLFRKQKQQSQTETPAEPSQEQPKQEATAASEPNLETTTAMENAPTQEPVTSALEKKPESTEPLSKTYLKAMPLKTVADVENVKNEVKNGNIIILRVTPLATKSIDDVKNAVNELTQFAESIGGDIARLGEERVVICPQNIRIWREKSPSSSEPLPTTASTAA